MLRLAAEPNRWISVTAPLSACSAFRPAVLGAFVYVTGK